MLGYIEHPEDLPIYVIDASSKKYTKAPQEKKIKSNSRGAQVFSNLVKAVRDTEGLSFTSIVPWHTGTRVHIQISISNPAFEADAIVQWCNVQRSNNKRQGAYHIGVKLCDANAQYRLRMVEQACHILHYQNDMRNTLGRDLSQEQAATEWIEKFAQEFAQ